MRSFVKRLMPASAQDLARNRLLGRFQHWFADPHLWHMRRRTVATGAAIGVFFAFIIPVGQIPFAVLIAVLIRANIPIACAATFVNTPLTFGPVYYGAYLLGGFLLGLPPQDMSPFSVAEIEELSGLALFSSWVKQLGPSLVVGTLALAVGGSLLAYFSVHMGWRFSVAARRRRRNTGAN